MIGGEKDEGEEGGRGKEGEVRKRAAAIRSEVSFCIRHNKNRHVYVCVHTDTLSYHADNTHTNGLDSFQPGTEEEIRSSLTLLGGP